ncbi:MAG: phage tail tape measure protein [Clostridiales bacterium]|nr:phage tail tape measure protein [Clostridiales bacterium]
MAESLRDLVVSLSLNTDNFTRNIKSVNKQIQEAESYFKLASAGIDGFDTSAAGLSSKLEMLERKLSLQKDAVGQYEKALQAATAKLTECYNRQQDYSGRLAEAKQKQSDMAGAVQAASAKYEELKHTLGETDSATIAAKQNMEAAQQEYAQATAEVEKLAGQEDALKRSTQNAADAVSTAQTQLNRANAAVRETEAAIQSTNRQLRTAQSMWTSAGKAMTEFGNRCEKAGKSAEKIGRTLTRTVTTPIAGLATTAVKASLDFESSFALVRKTVNGTEQDFDTLAAASKRMSTEIATSTSDINAVMATGGQLGIATEHIEEFARVMIDLSKASTDLDADTAATQLAKFANIMGTSQSQFSNIGSTIAMLGNNFATTEAPIAEMAMRIAGAGRQIGLTEAQVLGLATALSSVGIQAQAGGSSVSKALIKMEVAATTGGDALKDFSRVCGLTEQEFVNAWKSDPIMVFQRFIESLAQMNEEGISSVAVLDEIGISEIRLRDTMLRAVNATELFANAQEMAESAWSENTALAQKAGVRYGTTASKLTNLKNKAVLFAQTLGNDLMPTLERIMEGVSGFIDKLNNMDSSERQQIIRIAAIAASVGPLLLIFGKLTKTIGIISKGIGTFATAVGAAGGGFSGFMSVLASSPAVWLAVAAAVIAGTIALVDYVSGARAAREALKGLEETAKNWKETAADTFYGNSEGLSFFGMTTEDFARSGKKDIQSAQEWLDGMTDVWSDGKKETNAIVNEWTESWKALTASTRTGLESLKETADKNGYTGLSSQMEADLKLLDSMDKEITSLLKKRQSRNLTDKDKVRLQELIDTRNAIVVKYHLVPESSDADGFDTLRKKMEAEIARAEARGQEVSSEVYENTMVGAAQGMAAVNKQLDAQYDQEYEIIKLIEDETEREQALADLNSRYNANRRAAALEYAALMKDAVMPVWQKDDIQETKGQVGDLMQLLRQYSAATTEAEKNAFLPEFNKLTASMDEGALTEYIGLLTQIQSLLDSGMSEEEVREMFPEIDFSSALEQLAAIQQFLNDNKWDTNLKSLNEMFGEAVGEEVLKITTDLDMTGAKARWEEWASNPGAITTDAIIQGYTEAENAEKQQPIVEAFVGKYTEVPEGADKASLTPTGMVAYVTAYAEATTGTDVSALNPTNVTAMVNAYQELASGTDVSQLKPSEITAYVFKYLEDNEVDTTGLTPEAVTAFVMAYEEIQGGASTAALQPSGVVGLIVKYAEAENVDLSALNSAQVEGIVTKFSEATGCDKSELIKEFTAYITEYKEANGVKKPTLTMQIGLSGYDMLAYRQWLKNNKVEVEGIVRLSEAYEDPSGALGDPGVKFWKDGEEIPITAVTADMLKPDDVAILDKDGTMHILITAEVTGAPEAIAEIREQVSELDQLQVTAFGRAAGIMPSSLLGFIDAAERRIENFRNPGFLDFAWLTDLIDGNARLRVLDQSMQSDFNADRLAQLSTYVAEVVAAIKNGEPVTQEDIDNLNKILKFVQDLDAEGVGGNVTAGIAEGMTEAGWDTTAETVADNLETAINSAFIIESPSQRMKPTGEYVAAGIAEGMAGYDFSAEASTLAAAIEQAVSGSITAESMAPYGIVVASSIADTLSGYDMTSAGGSVAEKIRNAVSASLNAISLRSVGVNAMNGLAAGIQSGQASVVSSIRKAAQAAVTAAKSTLKIASPSRVFRDEVGEMAMKGFGEGVTRETAKQVKTISNAARYLTDAAKESSIGYTQSDNSKTYNSTSSVNFTGSNFYIRDEQDVRSLAVEIASLTRRQQRGRGLRMA